MKIREKLNSQLRWGFLIMFSGWIFMVVLMIFFDKNLPEYVPVVGFMPFIGGILYLNFGICCPKCKFRIGYMISYSIDVLKFALPEFNI
jgi:hypothetical protein